MDKGINAKTSNGVTPMVTPLYLVTNGSSFEAVQLLVEKGADVDPIVKGFGTPLMQQSLVTTRWPSFS
jgi:hypothetical protein